MGAPSIAVIDLPAAALEQAPAVQLFFDWTRTILLNPSWDAGTLGSELEGKRLTIRPSAWPGEPQGTVDALPRQIRVPYYGEPPRLLGYAPLATAQSLGVNEDHLKRTWLGIRMTDAMKNPERLYFLQQDLAAHTDFMISWNQGQLSKYVKGFTPEAVRSRIAPLKWTSQDHARRLRHAQSVSEVLQERVRQRGSGTALRNFEASHLDALEDITNLIRGALPAELAKDWKRAELAHEDFAAGRLANHSRFRVRGFYRVHESVACDADSAYVFFYAELATAIMALSQSLDPRVPKMQQFWTSLVNVTVRMQRLFLKRFDEATDPRCFRLYARPQTPPLAKANDFYTKDIRDAGTDRHKLEHIMRGHSEHVQQDGGASCFDE